MSATNVLRFSNHGEARIQQRGVSKKVANLVFTYADRENRCRGSVVGLSVTKTQIRELQSAGLVTNAEAESLRKVVLLYSNNSEKLVTAIKGSSWLKAQRRYQKKYADQEQRKKYGRAEAQHSSQKVREGDI